MRRPFREPNPEGFSITVAIVTVAGIMFGSGAMAALVTVPSMVTVLYCGSAVVFAALTTSYWLARVRSRVAGGDGCTHRRTLE